MNVIVCMAISADGRTTGVDGDVSWVEDSDIERMDHLMAECGVMVMGSKTYAEFGDELPSDQALQVVMTTQESLLHKTQENVIFTNRAPAEVLKMIEEKGFSSVMLAGGEQLVSSFANAQLITELRLLVKPLLLGAGNHLLSALRERLTLTLQKTVTLENGTIELQFAVQKE